MPVPKRPLLRYPGGKWRIAKWIISNFPPHTRYVEPFGGAGSVLIRKPRVSHEVYNDIASEVVNVFRVMQDPETAQALLYKLKYTPFAREEYELSKEIVEDPIELARRSILRTFFGFGTTCMFNRTSGFRASSFYENRSVGLQWIDHNVLLEQYIERLRGVVIENKLAELVIKQQDSELTLFYCDPPYVQSTRYNEAIYHMEMDDDGHKALAEQLHQIEGMAIISGYPCDLYEDLYSGWKRVERQAIAGAPHGINYRTEVLWLSPNCQSRALPLFNMDGDQ